jgi:hypothetical protein
MYRLEELGDNSGRIYEIVPTYFDKEHKAMLGHCKMILEEDAGKIAV